MNDKNSDFFDKNADYYGTPDGTPKGTGWSELRFVNFIKSKGKRHPKVLDIGSGDGKFAERLASSLSDVELTALDPSKALLNKISDPRIIKVQGELPDKFCISTKFDFIHLTDVLHHVTGPSIKQSQQLVQASILKLKSLLNDDGFLLIKDLFMESPLYRPLSRTIAFYLLVLQNKIGIKIPSEEFILGLTVCFYCRSELMQIFHNCGFKEADYIEEFRKISFKERLLLASRAGRMTFILQKA